MPPVTWRKGKPYLKVKGDRQFRRAKRGTCAVCLQTYYSRVEHKSRFCSVLCANKRERGDDPKAIQALRKIATLYKTSPTYHKDPWMLFRQACMIAADALGVPWEEVWTVHQEGKEQDRCGKNGSSPLGP